MPASFTADSRAGRTVPRARPSRVVTPGDSSHEKASTMIVAASTTTYIRPVAWFVAGLAILVVGPADDAT